LDIQVALGLALAMIMIVAGLYLLLRKPRPPVSDAPISTPEIDGRPPVVPRAQRHLLTDTVADSERLTPVDARTDLHMPDIRAHRDVPRMDDVSDSSDLLSPTASPAVDSRIAPTVSPVLTERTDAAELDHMLSDLDHATAQMVPPVERANVDDWQGESSLLDAHLEDRARRDESTTLAQAQMIICLQLLTNSGRPMNGERVLHLLRQYGLRFGEMSLFHRFEEANGQGPLMFSVLRYTPDGPTNFDLETMTQEKFDGLTFFLALPNVKAVHGYDMMNSIAGLLARDLAADVFDEHMMPLTKQLREHYRHQVLEFRPHVE
jgi:cell division protein ZipA